jgi:hypothetical protein
LSDDAAPQRVTDLVGTVVRGPYGTGSKSARDAVWLETAERRLLLRRKTGPSFGDHRLDRFVGQRVQCSGFIVGGMLLAERIDVLS